MPRVSLDPKNNKFRKLTVLINGAVVADKKSADAVCRILDMSEKTARKYLGNPEELPLSKLLKLGRSVGILIEELRECIRY